MIKLCSAVCTSFDYHRSTSSHPSFIFPPLWGDHEKYPQTLKDHNFLLPQASIPSGWDSKIIVGTFHNKDSKYVVALYVYMFSSGTSYYEYF